MPHPAGSVLTPAQAAHAHAPPLLALRKVAAKVRERERDGRGNERNKWMLLAIISNLLLLAPPLP